MAYSVPRQYERSLVRSLKDAILRLALVDTGAMYDSIEVGIDIKRTNRAVDITLLVYAEDYMKYLVEPFDILSEWQALADFDQVIGDVLIDYTNYLFDEEGIRTAVDVEYNLDIELNNRDWFY